MTITKFSILITILFLLSNCTTEKKIDEKYTIVNIDGYWDLGYSLGEGNSIGRIDNISKAGWKFNYIYGVSDGKYYWFDKTKDDKYNNAEDIVIGPLTKKIFYNKMDSLGIKNIIFQIEL